MTWLARVSVVLAVSVLAFRGGDDGASSAAQPRFELTAGLPRIVLPPDTGSCGSIRQQVLLARSGGSSDLIPHGGGMEGGLLS